MHTSIKKFEILGFVSCTKNICISRIGLFFTGAIFEAVVDKKLTHLGTSAQFLDEGSVEPWFVDTQVCVCHQSIAIETLNIIAFVG